MDTNIRVRFLNPCSQYAEAYWYADFEEDGLPVWGDCYARSYISAEDAKAKLLAALNDKADAKRYRWLRGNCECMGARPDDAIDAAMAQQP